MIYAGHLIFMKLTPRSDLIKVGCKVQCPTFEKLLVVENLTKGCLKEKCPAFNFEIYQALSYLHSFYFLPTF